MPFIKESFYLQETQKAFVWVMREFGVSMSQAQRMIDRGRVLLNGERLKDKSQELQGEVEVVHFKPLSRGLKPFFRSRDFVVFDKPSGVLVHPKKMTTPYSMLDEVRNYGGINANSTHRIDKETSGVLLASLHREAESFLKSSFEAKKIKKSYRAWVFGEVKKSFVVERSILINDDYSQTKHKVFLDVRGKKAKTIFKPLFYDNQKDVTLLECNPLTGRTHQIRIHLFGVGHPIVGDPLYGRDFEIAEAYLEERLNQKDRLYYCGAKRLMLHAYKLDFEYKNRFIIVSRDDFVGKSKDIALPSRREQVIFDGWRDILSAQ
jgi:23S rRNA pseudouridine1911/1915/1917 synthase